MTMLSFRVSEREAAEAQHWAQLLGEDRSALLRDALHRYLVKLASEDDAKTWERIPPSLGEQSFAEVANWGPAEDWADATG
jgi:hypothetical protein